MPHVEGVAVEDAVSIDAIAANYNNAFYKWTEDRVLLPSVEELTRLIIPNNISLTAKVTQSAYEKSGVLNKPNTNFDINMPHVYWLRTPLANTPHHIYFVNRSGLLQQAPAYGAEPGVRPMIRIKTIWKGRYR